MMSSEKHASIVLPNGHEDRRQPSPSDPGLRHRPSQRAFTFNELPSAATRRRSSFLSDTLSETHKSFRSSTDDLLLPRVKTEKESPVVDAETSTTHWDSVPLGLALLPAIGGVFFKNGSAVITDVTLLGLAAIFLNWSLRLPWEWYHAAQAMAPESPDVATSFTAIVEEEDEDESAGDDDDRDADQLKPQIDRASPMNSNDELVNFQKELRFHELSALLACFLSPLVGAWLLHAIRGQLSRPSEGLVSNYNLTIFLLMAELRPMSHLMKMIQKRTLFLQRRVKSLSDSESAVEGHGTRSMADLNNRLEDLEAHIANKAVTPSPSSTKIAAESMDTLITKASSQANTDLRKTIQPELDALNRAMRRYEKRMTITAIQVEARLQDLETRLQDVVVLAAAAHRSADNQSHNFLMTLINWMSAIVVVPVQFGIDIIKLPGKFMQMMFDRIKKVMKFQSRPRGQYDPRMTGKQGVTRPRPIIKKPKVTTGI